MERSRRTLRFCSIGHKLPGSAEDTTLITYKSKREIAKMRSAGQVIAEIFDMLASWLRPGLTTHEVDQKVEGMIREAKGKPSFKGYCGFPASICASVNEQVVHGIPGALRLKEGDLFTVDVGVIMQGYHADAARSYAIGSVGPEVAKLADATARALNAGIQACRVGQRLSDVARAIETVGRDAGFGIVEHYVGHGIGTALHEPPQVPNFVSRQILEDDLVLREGLVIAIEPMFNLGTEKTRELSDGWTVVTADGKCSAHFEDTVVISENGPEVITRPSGREIAIWLGPVGTSGSRS